MRAMSTHPEPDDQQISRDDLTQPVEDPTVPPAPAPEQQEAEEQREDSAPPPQQQANYAPPPRAEHSPPTGPPGPPPGYTAQRVPAYSADSTLTNVQLNYWLTAIFGWPAVIFWAIDKDKTPLLDDHLKEVLNFGIVRVIAGVIWAVPVVGWILGAIASIATLIIGIMGALNGPDAYKAGQQYRYPWNFRFIS